MNSSTNHTMRPFLFRREIAAAMVVWTVMICGSLLWNWSRVGTTLFELARAEARSHFTKDILYRRWVAMQGGVYVPPTEKTPPNPYLAHLKDRDVVTTSGKKLTLLNPAYITRQVHEIANEQYGVRGHITSLKPIRPENAADAWETAALLSFEKGIQEVASIETVRGEPVLRFMRPLMTESSCLKCHGAQGYREGDVRGGISIQVPFEPYARSAWNQRKPLLFGHLLIGVLGLAGLGARQRHIAVSTKMLRESETKYHDIFSNIQDVYYRTDENGNFIDLSPSVLKYSGYSRDELIGKPAARFYNNPDDRAKVLAAMGKTGEVTDHEILMRTKDGRLVHASLNSHFLYDAAGKIAGVEGVLRDITERKKVENELKRAKEEWELTFDAIADPVMILDTDYRIVKANKAMAAALDVTPAEAIGMTCYKAVHGTETPPDFCPHATLLADGQAHSQEIFEPRLGGYYHISVSPLHAPDGSLVGSIHAARDITVLKQAEDMSRQYSYDLERLLAVSRDITVTTDLTSLYRSFVSTARDVLTLDFSTLMLLSEDKKTLTVQDCLGFPESMIGHFSLVEGQGLSTLVVKNKKPETVDDFISEKRFDVPRIVREKKIQSAIAVPMMMKDEIIGVLIGHTLDRRVFSQKDMDVYQHIGNQAAVAIRNALSLDMVKKGEQRIRDITASLGEGIYVLSGDGKVTFMNPEAEHLLGWTKAELLNKNIHDVIHNRRPDGTHLSFDDCPMHRVIDSGEHFISRDEMFIRKDGSVFPVSVISTPLREDGKVQAAITAFRDITERKKIEREREHLIVELQKALAEIKTLHGILPICSYCKKIRDEVGAWHQLETYISEHTDSQFSHGICKECAKRLYPEYFEKNKGQP